MPANIRLLCYSQLCETRIIRNALTGQTPGCETLRKSKGNAGSVCCMSIHDHKLLMAVSQTSSAPSPLHSITWAVSSVFPQRGHLSSGHSFQRCILLPTLQVPMVSFDTKWCWGLGTPFRDVPMDVQSTVAKTFSSVFSLCDQKLKACLECTMS